MQVVSTKTCRGSHRGSSGRFLYVGDADSAEISTFTINRDTGVLTELRARRSSGASAAIRVHPSGKFLYAANFDQGSISAFNIDSGTGG